MTRHASLLLVLVAPAALLAAQPPAASQEAPRPARAALVVDTGTEVKKVCLRFTSPSVAALAVLQRAGVDAKTTTFAGTGVAVCSLCGKGCPADGTCLTCGGNEYWSYWRAAAGSSTYEYAQEGVADHVVRDGDVDAWRWGDGKAPPPYETVESICDDPASTTVDLDGVVPTTATSPKGDGDRPATEPWQLGAFVVIVVALTAAGGVMRRRARQTAP